MADEGGPKGSAAIKLAHGNVTSTDSIYSQKGSITFRFRLVVRSGLVVPRPTHTSYADLSATGIFMLLAPDTA